ncbi:unnamed protein product [Cyprideis torosa]|uniref:Uncharacterized protein n=1 Tax=Cyprideis torosa TaxID=163714 RepID=A0A7R8WQ00_9CRUS|nr:unnamed protein product [Cyprideis torosa]CAG0902124.1 unnamed protein product [Cyprideis torosa]
MLSRHLLRPLAAGRLLQRRTYIQLRDRPDIVIPHKDDPGGIVGANLPFNIYGSPLKLLLKFAIFAASAVAIPFFMVRWHLYAKK